MAIKITTAADPMTIDTICLTLYAQPGLGKSSLAFTASKPLLLDFDKGAYRAVERKDTVQIASWADVASITAEDLATYDTLVLDTVGKALDFLSADIIAKNSRHAYGGALNQQGWGQLGVRFGAFLRHVRGMGKDIVLVSHMDEKADGEGVKERLKIPGGSQHTVTTDSDAMARISIHNRQRQLVFSPTETSFGKDPANIGMVIIPDASTPEFKTFLADQIAAIKAGLNQLSEAQVERRSEVEWFEQALPNVMDADGINDLLGRAKKAGKDVSKMVMDRANALGLEFDGDARKFVYLEDMDQNLEQERANEGEAA